MLSYIDWLQKANPGFARVDGEERDKEFEVVKTILDEEYETYKKEFRWHQFFMNVAIESSKLSTCRRLHVGACLVHERRIISTGFNGTAKGQKHCNEIFTGEEEDFLEKHHEFSRVHEIHAETNNLLDAGKRGTLKDGSVLYVTLSPCSDCAKLIVTCGVKEVVYLDLYDRDQSGINYLREFGLKIRQYY